jgi:hypothetical protein
MLAEESALWWALRIVNPSPEKTLGEILKYERKVEKGSESLRSGRSDFEQGRARS